MATCLGRQVPLAVLVREDAAAAERPGATAHERVDDLLAKFETHWQRRLKRPVVLVGDINAQDLGLSAEHRRWIAEHCRSIVHSAASLSFRPASESPENEPYRSNLDGTARVAAACERAIAPPWPCCSAATPG
jgi:thioester reductase-like protein